MPSPAARVSLARSLGTVALGIALACSASCRTDLDWELGATPIPLVDLGAVPDFAALPVIDFAVPPDAARIADFAVIDLAMPVDFSQIPVDQSQPLDLVSVPDFAMVDFSFAPDLVSFADLAPPPASCVDGIKNGLETDVDCGGGICPRCTIGRTCSKASDCVSATCGNAKRCLGQLSFGAPVEWDVNSSPATLIAADWNGDGKPDLATATTLSSVVVIRLGLGDGSFGKLGYFPTADQPVALAAADLNGDHRLDLITADGTGLISRILGNGDGTFTSGTSYAAGNRPAWLATGDFDSDGNVDVLAADTGVIGQNSGGLSLLLGRGDGSLNAATAITAGTNPPGVAAADFNRDGKLDVVVASLTWQGTVQILLGDGTGKLAAPVAYAAGNNPFAVAAADMNGDGLLDVVSMNVGLENVSVLLGHGDGTFGNHVDYFCGHVPAAMVVGDFNLDGNRDLAVLNNLGTLDTISILLGSGDGTLQAPFTVSGGGGQGGLAIADFNLDGKPDLAVTNVQNNSVTVILNSSQ